MTIKVNGNDTELPDAISIAELVRDLGLAPDRLAVEVNRKIIRRANWDSTTLVEGDRVEIVHFVGGGCSSAAQAKQVPQAKHQEII